MTYGHIGASVRQARRVLVPALDGRQKTDDPDATAGWLYRSTRGLLEQLEVYRRRAQGSQTEEGAA